MTLFDQADPSAAPPRRLSLVKLSSELARSVASLGRVTVEGEVVKPQTRPSGRTYFTLRDRAAQLSVTFSAARARHCRAVHGERVSVTGVVGYLPDRGQVQLAAEEVVPVGAGAIAAMLVEARSRLAAEGLIDRPRRRLPRLPRKVGVVCGADAAVRGDIESVVEARMPGYPVRFQEVSVSGPGAAESIAAGLSALLGDAEVEVVILARGGGDAVSLLPFSDEALCRAISAAPVPVVVAIGHEGDRPLCDEVADLRAATPSLAAAAVIPSRVALEEELDLLMEKAARELRAGSERALSHLAGLDPAGAARERVAAAGERLARNRSHLAVLHPGRRIAEAGRLLDRVDRHSGMSRRLARGEGELAGRLRTLDALDPARVLARGYAVVRSGGSVVRDAAQVAVGDRLAVTLARGSLSASVEAVERG